jgi:hypothetical protein
VANYGLEAKIRFPTARNFSPLHQVLGLSASYPKQKNVTLRPAVNQSIRLGVESHQILVSVRPLRIGCWGAPYLTRGRVVSNVYRKRHSRSKVTGAWRSPIAYHQVRRGRNSGTLSPGLLYAFTVWHRDRSTFASAAKNARCYTGTDNTTAIHILVYFTYFEKIKLGLCDLHAVCMPLCLRPPPINAWMPNQFLLNLAPDPILTAYFINPSHHSVCLYVLPPFIARQRLGKHIHMATNTCNNTRIVGHVFAGLCVPL